MTIITKGRAVGGLHCSARFSQDERYRYDLLWRWAPGPLLVAWMLNPSTATHEKLDPTVAGVKKRAEARGLGGVRVINLFAYRATQPADMKAQADPVGPENDRIILEVLREAAGDGSPVFVGWGAHGKHRMRQLVAQHLLNESGVEAAYAFKLNADGSPQHPLYVAHALEPVKWFWREQRG